ncbi:putative proline--tRNA ligase, mitochondrial [Portunus trituberculatus]|uniref:Putative proline--tRNA ligase, mitochondrial n=1 Tax=Portunus trituberculatus TaxID=210409 RepID=A0A5B7F1H3_PORTR|nr:putative proline--tRNA ligase, mitochondrial [Portunus trituberculatus]
MSEIYPFSFRQLPLRLYQINSKFRDEMKPRFGLLRCREFIMKDLYTFDDSVEAAHDTYEEICSSYDRIFRRLQIPFLKVTGDCGNIGGSHSHEYHYISPTGEDTLFVCDNCGNTKNAELVSSDESDSCDKCGSHVGHTFLLGTKYSKPFKASYQNELGKPELLQMGCYGIGVSRLLAACVEVLAQDKNIKWPWEIVPFKICLIGPKRGSKEASSALWVDHLAEVMSGMPDLQDEVLVDDRDRLTIGKRVMEAKQTGYPFIIVVGKRACEMVPMFELLDCTMGKSEFLSHKMLMNWVRKLPLRFSSPRQKV